MADSKPNRSPLTPEQLEENLRELLNTTETVCLPVPCFALEVAKELAPQLNLTFEQLLSSWIGSMAFEIVLAGEPLEATDDLPVQ